MKKISKKREKEIDAILKADGDEKLWDNRQLGHDPSHAKVAPEYSKNDVSGSVGRRSECL